MSVSRTAFSNEERPYSLLSRCLPGTLIECCGDSGPRETEKNIHIISLYIYRDLYIQYIIFNLSYMISMIQILIPQRTRSTQWPEMFLFLLSSHHAFGTAMGLALMHTFLVLAILIDNLLVTWPDLAICELIDLDQTIYPQWDQKNIRHQCTSPPCRCQCEFEKRIPERSSANVRILEDITYINFW